MEVNGIVPAAQRSASGAANSRSEARAEALGGRLQALVELSALRGGCAQTGVGTARMTGYGRRGQGARPQRPPGGIGIKLTE